MLKTGFYRPPTTGSTEYSDAPYRTRSVQVIFLASEAHVIVGRLLLRPERGEAVASVLFAFTATGLIALLYNLNPFNSWALLVGVWASSKALILYRLQNQRKNEKKFQKHPVSFPNPEGGGILGEYVNRPWQNELAELGRRYPSKKAKKQKKD
ncbi:hypothetical protein E6H37_05765 [Candidatus Bathyarchaeota archaeon]|nr:MAG: hypothetical protein E6H37_05765 [Candidatus Bathyarchaeota archaeon]